jgi:hypothetical protein
MEYVVKNNGLRIVKKASDQTEIKLSEKSELVGAKFVASCGCIHTLIVGNQMTNIISFS